MLLQPKNFVEPDTFHCRAYGRRLSIFECMKSFVDVNALAQKDKPCFKCVQGEETRLSYAKN